MAEPRLAAFDSLREEMGVRLQALLGSASAEVETILTPEQRVNWAKTAGASPAGWSPHPAESGGGPVPY